MDWLQQENSGGEKRICDLHFYIYEPLNSAILVCASVAGKEQDEIGPSVYH